MESHVPVQEISREHLLVEGPSVSSKKTAIKGLSSIHGWGLFAPEDMSPKEIINASSHGMNDAGMIFDPCIFEDNDCLDFLPNVSYTQIQNLKMNYTEKSLKMYNCVLYFDENIKDGKPTEQMMIIRPVKKGEELLRIYGWKQWIYFWRQSNDISKIPDYILG